MPSRKSPVSFINEHTAEYYLLANLSSQLLGYYARITPLFFWSNREGSSISQEGIQKGLESKISGIIGIFPRRPKVFVPGQAKIFVKINISILRAAQFGQREGIPLFAGVPLASNIVDLHWGVECAWLSLLNVNVETDYFLEIPLKKSKEIHDFESHNKIQNLTKRELIETIANYSKPILWESAMTLIKEIRNSANPSFEEDSRSWPFYGGYKPFFVLLHK